MLWRDGSRVVAVAIDCEQKLTVTGRPRVITCRHGSGAGFTERAALLQRGAPPLVITTGSVAALSPAEIAEGACQTWAAGWIRAKKHIIETFEPQGRVDDTTGEGVLTRWRLETGQWRALSRKRQTYPACKKGGAK